MSIHILRTVFLISVFAATAITATLAAAKNAYRTQRIETLCERVGLKTLCDTISDGSYHGQFGWENKSLSIHISNGEVDHIGIQLFTEKERQILPLSPAYDFIERYVLEELTHVLKDVDFSSRYMAVEDIEIECGNIKSLDNVLCDSTLTFCCTLDNGRRYHLSWSGEDKPFFNISFPASYRLLGGYNGEEATRRLRERIVLTDSICRFPEAVDMDKLTVVDSIAEDYYVLKGEYHVLPLITNDRYYFHSDSTATLIFSPAYPVESLFNLLTTGEIENSYKADIRMWGDGGKTYSFTLPLYTLINHFINEGCTPYIGLKGLYPLNNQITALLEMVNHASGYEHMMSITFNTSTIPRKDGLIEIRLFPYIPLHDIMNLYPN